MSFSKQSKSGLTIKTGDDVDQEKLQNHAPDDKNAWRLNAFMKNIEFQVSKKTQAKDGSVVPVDSAMVIVGRGGQVEAHLNPDFVESYVHTYYDLYTLLFHELNHISTGQLLEEKIKDAFPEDFWRTSAGKRVKTISEELLIKHLEHNALKDDKYHEISRRTYRDEDPPMNIFYRGTPEEEIEDVTFIRLHRRAFSKRDYSVRETSRALKYRHEQTESQRQDQGQQGQKGESSESNTDANQQSQSQSNSQGESSQENASQDDSSEGQPQGSSQGSQDSDNNEGSGKRSPSGGLDMEDVDEGEKESQGDGDSDKDQNNQDGEGSENEDDSQKDSEGDNGDQKEDNNSGQEGQSTQSDSNSNTSGGGYGEQKGDPPMVGSQSYSEGGPEENEAMQDLMEAMADVTRSDEDEDRIAKEIQKAYAKYDVTNHSEIRQTMRKAEVKPNVFEKVGRIVNDYTGEGARKSVVPDFRHDRRAMQAYSMGRYVSHYRRRNTAVEKDFIVFYDVSPSQESFVPYCNEIVIRNKSHLWKKSLYCFAGRNSLSSVRTRDFIKVARQGPKKVQDQWGGAGTNFSQVVDKIQEKKFMKVIVISDDKSTLSSEHKSWLEKWFSGQKHVFVLVHTNPSCGYGTFEPISDYTVGLDY